MKQIAELIIDLVRKTPRLCLVDFVQSACSSLYSSREPLEGILPHRSPHHFPGQSETELFKTFLPVKTQDTVFFGGILIK